MKVEDVIEQAKTAVKENFKNYDWQEEAEEAAVRIAEGDIKLAQKIARAAQKLPNYTRDDTGVKCAFLFWEMLKIKLEK